MVGKKKTIQNNILSKNIMGVLPSSLSNCNYYDYDYYFLFNGPFWPKSLMNWLDRPDALLELISARICNLFRVIVINRLLIMRDTEIFDVH